ncbi:hypothetical protein ACFWCB_09805, partial [Streptomyces sp. NPDC060048]
MIYDDSDWAFWGDNAGPIRNWIGRLLELVRSELHDTAHRIGRSHWRRRHLKVVAEGWVWAGRCVVWAALSPSHGEVVHGG